MNEYDVVVIGYGSELRSDDGVGRRVAEAIDEKALPGVSTFSVQQLIPELAVPLARARLAIFVDAARASEADGVRVEPVSTSSTTTWAEHVGHPEALLALTEAVYGARPEAWWVLVPGTHFDFGLSLSATATAGFHAAVDQIRGMVATRQCATA